MKQFCCGDVVPGCQAVFRAEDESTILTMVGEHARADHGIEVVSPPLVEQVRSHTSDLAAVA